MSLCLMTLCGHNFNLNANFIVDEPISKNDDGAAVSRLCECIRMRMSIDNSNNPQSTTVVFRCTHNFWHMRRRRQRLWERHANRNGPQNEREGEFWKVFLFYVVVLLSFQKKFIYIRNPFLPETNEISNENLNTLWILLLLQHLFLHGVFLYPSFFDFFPMAKFFFFWTLLIHLICLHSNIFMFEKYNTQSWTKVLT